ncbi:hypothetical protein SEVCU041_0168 [Staphylococcus epidermidis VCU041]|nr:hypothetical protein SEVCU041_0168 [Staphylococcus epidermidis VCU041]
MFEVSWHLILCVVEIVSDHMKKKKRGHVKMSKRDFQY